MIYNCEKLFNDLFQELGYDIAWQNLVFNASALTEFRKTRKEYLKIDYLWAQSENTTLGCGRLPGIIQCSVYTKMNTGSYRSSKIVDEIMTKFPRGFFIKNEDIELQIDKPPYASNGLDDNGWYFVPVSIPIEIAV